jgi:uncharacterized protein YerC
MSDVGLSRESRFTLNEINKQNKQVQLYNQLFYAIMTKSMLSLHIRWQIIEKTLEGLTTRQIAKNLGISKSAVDHVCQYFRKHRRVEKLPLPRIFNSNDLKYLEVLLKERVDWYLYELQSEWDFGCEEV